MNRKFTPEELADRWYDRREVINLAGKLVTSILLKREGEVFDRFWSDRDDVCLCFNDGAYVGPEAVRGYFSVMAENNEKRVRFMQTLFPEELAGRSDDELRGIGHMRGLPITTPVVEIAGDGQTAKGLWHIQGADNGVTPFGPLSYWTLGFLGLDFWREKDGWKIWHVLHAEDILCPMGESWTAPKTHESQERYLPLAELKKPPYTVERTFYTPYTPERPFTAPPAPPEPYVSFADTFSYGI